MEYKKCLLFLAVSAMGLVSCSVKNNDLAAKQETGGIRLEVADFVDVDGIFAKDDAKSTFSYDSNKGFVFSWTQGDEIGIFPIAYRTSGDVSKPQQMMMVVDTGSGSTLSGAGYNGSTVGWSVSGDILYASYYPMQENYGLLPDNIILDYSGQKQIGNDIKGENMGHLGAYDYLYTAPTTPNDVNDIKFSFQHAGAIVRFRVPTETAGTFTSLTVTAAGNVFPAQMKLNLLTHEISVEGTLSNTFTVNLENFEKTADNYLNVWCMMSPVDLSGETLTVTFVKGTAARNINYEVSGRNLEAGKAYSFNGTDATIPDFIDLGLPSGTLWASWNVGATSATEIGNYYAWGETETKAIFSSDNYKFYPGPTSGSYSKYNSSDKLPELTAEDDAAKQNFGVTWCMPTKAQWEELQSYCILTYDNALQCTKVEGCNGQYIYIPDTGYKLSVIKNSDEGNYWCSGWNNNLKSSYKAYIKFANGKSSIKIDEEARYTGICVRAVKVNKTSPTEYIDLGLPSGNLWGIDDFTQEGKSIIQWGGLTTNDMQIGGSQYPSNSNPSGYRFYSTKPVATTNWEPTNEYKLTRYTTNSDSAIYGNADNNTVLDAEDDVATQNWGTQWRIPTIEDWRELYDNCDWEIVNGDWIVSRNGKHLILKHVAASANQKVGTEYIPGNGGGYWSSSLFTDSSNPIANHSAYFVAFRTTSTDKDKAAIANRFNAAAYRYKHYFIRPICGGTSHANE